MFATSASRTEPVPRPLTPAEMDRVEGGSPTLPLPPPRAALFTFGDPPMPWSGPGALSVRIVEPEPTPW
jgi:hypothetical protein